MRGDAGAPQTILPVVRLPVPVSRHLFTPSKEYGKEDARSDTSLPHERNAFKFQETLPPGSNRHATSVGGLVVDSYLRL